MAEKRSWFQRPLAASCLLAALVFLSIYIILSPGEIREPGEEISYRVTLRHYGTDAREMETSAAIPLEDALSSIPGLTRIMTMSENGRLRTYANIRQKRGLLSREENDFYDAVREAAQRVYETMPSSAQRPELSSSGDFQAPFWTAAVYASSGGETPDGALLEKLVKPALDSIEGVGDVEIAGAGTREILVILDGEKIASMGLNPGKIAGILAANDGVFTGGSLRFGGMEIKVQADGRYAELKDLAEALIPLDNGACVRLAEIGEIREQFREGDTLSRLNGKKTAVISVTAASGADTRLLSARIKKELAALANLPLEIAVLEDRGAEEAAAFRSVFIAALQASFLVAAGTLLLGRGGSMRTNGLICAAAIPLILVISAAILIGTGFPINKKLLAGLAIGIGCAVDAVILSAEGFGKAKIISAGNIPGGTSSAGKLILGRIWPPLFSGAATTIAALIPLSAIGAAGEISVIAAALGTVTIVSFVLALTLLPPLFFSVKTPVKRQDKQAPGKAEPALPAEPAFTSKLPRRLSRLFAAQLRFCMKRSFVFPVLSLLISAAAIFALTAAGADTSGEWAEDSVYAQFEFEGGLLKEELDPLLASWAEELVKMPALRNVQTGARTGSAYALVTFDPAKKKTGEIMDLIRSKKIPGAFVYIPEASPGDRIWTITVSGDESEKCRELVKAAASVCSELSPVKETVLNFKPGGPKLDLYPRREILARAGIFFSSPADTLRRAVHGPVAYKRIEEAGQYAGKETDLRIKYSDQASGDEVLRIPIAAGNLSGTTRVSSVMEAFKSQEVSGIQRENRRRIASLSVRTGPGDPRIFRDKIMLALKELELPAGYKIEFDPEAIRRAEALSGKFLNFIWAVLFCYMIIAAAEESFILPLIILSSVLPSLAVPVLVLVISGAPVNAAAACALIAVSGMTVNASVLSAGELWRRLRGRDPGEMSVQTNISFYSALKYRLSALLVTSGTTIAGALPFLFLAEANNSLVRILALVTVLGVGTSFFCSLTLVPSLMKIYVSFHKPCSASRGTTSTGSL